MRGDRPAPRRRGYYPWGLKSTRLRSRPRSHRLLAALPAAAAVLAVVHVARIALGPAGSWERSAADARLYAAAIILCGLAAFGRGRR